MKTFITFLMVSCLLAFAGCIPGTYYDPSDPYVRGLRNFDRGLFYKALGDWEPLARAGDCDAQK